MPTPSRQCNRHWIALANKGAKSTAASGLSNAVPSGGYYVRPALVEITADAPITRQETFAPILYLFRYDNLDEAIERHNAVPQGLSSAIVTGDLREAELFCSPAGSDCGIVNVNLGTSGAEIGGASAAKKKPVAAANRAPTPGSNTCAASPAP